MSVKTMAGVVETALTKLSLVKPGYYTGIGDLLQPVYHPVFVHAHSAWPSLRG